MTLPGLTPPADNVRLIKWCKLLLELKTLTVSDRAACTRYTTRYSGRRYDIGPTKILQLLTVAEKVRVEGMRTYYNRRKK